MSGINVASVVSAVKSTMKGIGSLTTRNDRGKFEISSKDPSREDSKSLPLALQKKIKDALISFEEKLKGCLHYSGIHVAGLTLLLLSITHCPSKQSTYAFQSRLGNG